MRQVEDALEMFDCFQQIHINTLIFTVHIHMYLYARAGEIVWHWSGMIKPEDRRPLSPSLYPFLPPSHPSHLIYAPAVTYSLKERFNWISSEGAVGLTKQKNRVWLVILLSGASDCFRQTVIPVIQLHSDEGAEIMDQKHICGLWRHI